MTRTVVVDTNALMMPVELDVRLFDELDRLLGGERASPGGEDVAGASPAGSRATEEPAADSPEGVTDGPSPDATIGASSVGFEPVVPQPVIEELRRLSEGGGEEGIAASVGHDLATDRCLPVDADAPYADDAVAELAREGVADYVVTNDQPLRDRVLDAGVPVISLRGANTLAITEP